MVASIIDFNMFDDEGFHPEFRPLEVTRREQLSDKMTLHFFGLRKLPKEVGPKDMLLLWLQLFSAETEEDLRKIAALEVPVMNQAIKAYKESTVTPKFVEAARRRDLAAHNEASALRHARTEERRVWQGVVAEKDATIAEKDVAIAGKVAENERLRAENVDKNIEMAKKDAEIEQLNAQLAKFQAELGG